LQSWSKKHDLRQQPDPQWWAWILDAGRLKADVLVVGYGRSYCSNRGRACDSATRLCDFAEFKRRVRPWVDVGSIDDVPFGEPKHLDYVTTIQDGYLESES
jgi:hypothetical protein